MPKAIDSKSIGIVSDGVVVLGDDDLIALELDFRAQPFAAAGGYTNPRCSNVECGAGSSNEVCQNQGCDDNAVNGGCVNTSCKAAINHTK